MVKKRSLPGFELMKRKLEQLVEKGEELSKILPEAYYPARKWTPLKLILLMVYVSMYSKIMTSFREKLHFPQKIFYVDPLAGAGINKIKDTDDFVAGSPIISVVFSSDSFDKYFFSESDSQRREALKARMEKLLPQNKFCICNDCNVLLNHVAEYLFDIGANAHYLLFVDCEGIEPHWRVMSKILSYPGDLIFVFQTVVVWEQIRRWRNYKGVTNFFGTKDWEKVKKKEELVEIYKKQVSNVSTAKGSTRRLIDHVTIKGDIKEGSFHYDVIFAARETKGGSPWFYNFMQYANKVVKQTGKSVERALNVMKGRDSQLDWFIQPKTTRCKITDFF